MSSIAIPIKNRPTQGLTVDGQVHNSPVVVYNSLK